MKHVLSRREALKLALAVTGAAGLAACQVAATPQVVEKVVTQVVPATPEVVKETVVVEKEVVVGGLPIVQEPLTLRGYAFALYSPAPGITSLNDQIFFKEMAKRTNITIQWEHAPADVPGHLDLVMASGDLPDFFGSISIAQASDYGQQGALAPLNELIDKYAPNFKEYLLKYPEIKGMLTAPDGNIYAFPRILLDPETRMFAGFFVRKDWLEEIGGDIPATVEDVYQMLKAMKAKDPNRYPMTWDPRPLVWMWGVNTRGDASWEDFYQEQRKVKHGPSEPLWQEGIDFIRRLYEEGLLDPEYSTAMNQPDFVKQRFISDISGFMYGYAGSHVSAITAAMKETHPEIKMVPLAPPKGPYGEREIFGCHNIIDASTGGAISSSCKYKAELVRYIDYYYSWEGVILSQFGVEGDTFTFVDGKPTYTDKVVNNEYGLSVIEYAWNYIAPIWFGPMVYPKEAYLQTVSEDAREALMTWAKHTPTKKLPVLNFSREENNRLRATMTDINTLLDETVSAYIDGSKPIKEHAAVVEQIKGMGIDEVLGIYEAALGRYYRSL